MENEAKSSFEESTWREMDKEIGHVKESNALAGEHERDKFDDIDDLLAGRATGEVEPEAVDSEKNTGEENQESEAKEDEIIDVAPDEADDEPEAVDDEGDDDIPDGDDEDPAKLYATKVKMPFGMAEMTVGEMKDVVVEVNRITAEAEKEKRQAFNEREYLRDLIAVMGELPPQAQMMVRQYIDKDMTRQTQALLDKIPEWNDNVTYTRESGQLASLADEYGISNYEYQAIRDNRHIHILRDFNKARQRNAELESRMKEMQKQIDAQQRQERSKGKKPMAKRQIQTNAQKKIAELVKAGRKFEAIDQLLS